MYSIIDFPKLENQFPELTMYTQSNLSIVKECNVNNARNHIFIRKKQGKI